MMTNEEVDAVVACLSEQASRENWPNRNLYRAIARDFYERGVTHKMERLKQAEVLLRNRYNPEAIAAFLAEKPNDQSSQTNAERLLDLAAQAEAAELKATRYKLTLERISMLGKEKP